MSSTGLVGYVFGYGSLVDPGDALVLRHARSLADPIYGIVSGYRRRWNVAKDNLAAMHDHKYYADPVTGVRLPIKVAFLNLSEGPAPHANGIAIPVNEERLRLFDARERGMMRVDVSDRFSTNLPAPLWAYSDASGLGQTIFAEGRRDHDIWIRSEYLHRVEAAFRALGAEPFAQYLASTDTPTCPVRSMRIIRAPGDAGI